ncbi:hypothetical protein ACFV4P_23315 [Kitasatospora sp. NPDC059795]|uniref:hypothetical protein n=1 Tax=Kitasatospora sp. NPDC059795 TaxID=3346949 RepID=UPI003655B616
MKLRLAAALGTAAALLSLVAGSGTAGASVTMDDIVIGSSRFIDHRLTSIYGSYELSSTTLGANTSNTHWRIASAAPTPAGR